MSALRLTVLLVATGCTFPPPRASPERRYRDGQYQLAYDGFRTLMDQRGSDPSLQYDVGLALFRLGRFNEAATSFRGATQASGALAQRAWYNLGTTYLEAAATATDRIEMLRQSVVALIEALALDPADPDAKWNLEVAERRLGEAALAMNPGPTHRATWGAGNLTKSGYGGEEVTGARAGGGAGSGAGSPSGPAAPRLTPEQARRLLTEFRARQQGHPDRPRPSESDATTERRDW